MMANDHPSRLDPREPAIGPRKQRRRVGVWPLFVIAVPAGVAVWSGWVGLGQLTGFGVVHPLPGIADQLTLNTAITLPIGVEAYAAYAMRVWFAASGIPRRARRFAAWSAMASLLVGLAGQSAYHLMEAAEMTRAPWGITLAVSCLPVAVFGMAMALAHLVHGDDDQQDPEPRVEASTEQTSPGPDTDVTPVAITTEPVIEHAQPAPVVPRIPALPPTEPAPIAAGSSQVAPESEHAQNSPAQPGKPSTGNAEIVRRAAVANPGASIAQLVALTGLSTSTVRRYRQVNGTPAPDLVEAVTP